MVILHLEYKETKRLVKISERISKHVEPHLHSALEIVYVTEGTLELGMGTELFHMETGDIGFIFPDVIHHYQVLGSGTSKAYYIQIQPLAAGAFFDKLQKFAPKCPVVTKEKISADMVNAITAVVRTSESEEMVVEAYVQIILAKCLPELSLVEKQNVGSTDLVYQVVSYISAHFREEMSLEKMASDLGVSKFVLSRTFSRTFHRNFSQYLNDTRMNYAVHCLETTNDNILDISMESGFDSQRTFNRAFKDRYHMTPSEYKKNCKGI